MTSIQSLLGECKVLNPSMKIENLLAVLEAESKQELDGIEDRTRQQAGSRLWHVVRKCRITATKAHHVLGALRKNPDTELTEGLRRIITGDTPPIFRLPAVRYGFFQERHALEAFRRYMRILHSPSVSVQKVGVKVSAKHFELAASPDGILKCDCGCGPALIEIKCPFRLKEAKLTDIKLDFLDNDFNLRTSHKYHTQIQMQMGIFAIPKCYFVVYSPISGVHVQLITFDAEKWLENEEKLVTFYREKFLPAIIENE